MRVETQDAFAAELFLENQRIWHKGNLDGSMFLISSCYNLSFSYDKPQFRVILQTPIDVVYI